MPDAVVAPVEGQGISAVQPLDAGPEVWLRRLDHQMDVVRHQAEAQEMPPLAFDDRGQEPDIRHVVVVVREDAAPLNSSGNDVIDGARNLVSRWKAHVHEKKPATKLRPVTDTTVPKTSEAFERQHSQKPQRRLVRY